MVLNAKELADVVSVVKKEKSYLPIWNGMAQWTIEATRKKLSRQRASQYGVLQVLHASREAAYRVNRRLAPDLRSDHLASEMEKLNSKEKAQAKAFIAELDARIRQLNVAYVVVASMGRLASGLISADGRSTPEILRNRRGRWHYTKAMRSAYGEMVDTMSMPSLSENLKDTAVLSKIKDTVELRKQVSLLAYDRYITKFNPGDDYEKYSISGKAIVFAGNTAGGHPVLLSLDCTFDPEGQVEDLPEGYRVIMFKPRTSTVVKKWKFRKKPESQDASSGKGGAFEEGLTTSI